MRRAATPLALALLLLPVAGAAMPPPAAPPAAAPPRGAPPVPADLLVTNKAPRAINELYVSPTTADSWGDDRLGEAIVAPGHSTHVRLDGLRDCGADVQVVYDDASREERHGVDLCHLRALSFDGSAAAGAAAAASHGVVIVNGAARPIQQVLISSAASGDWGDDLLTGGSLSVGDRVTLAYHGDCLADLRVVYDNRSAEERRDLDLCGLQGVVVQPGWTTADHLPRLPDQTAAKAPP